MDTTKEYIQMSDCEEMQSKREFDDGDFIYQISTDCNFNFEYYSTTDSGRRLCFNSQFSGLKKDFVKLPQQGQLQEMFGWTQIQYHNDFNMFDDFFENGELPISWEKLWLRMYMKEKHNKTWNGEKWIKGT